MLADEVTALAPAGVDALFTNHPDQALAALHQVGLACGTAATLRSDMMRE
ncbi:MAG: hypothetical protein OXF68_16260 [Gammaproteobacteria bacterium]|nr:hypothetical protein [Gammaproteobacteria bacterium]